MINFSGRLAVMGMAFLAACGASQHASGDRPVVTAENRLWVLAPHPDDELLIAGEAMQAALAHHRPISVIVMTNGDLGCGRNGHARQLETLAALASIGVPERSVHFLGYPDGYLDSLGPVPLPPVARTQQDGSCGVGDSTYASHGAGNVDVHTLRTGAPGPYVDSGPVDDLAWLLEREPPSEIITTHGIDTHPDHAMTYAYLRRALAHASITPRVLRAIVHQGPCWPNGTGSSPCPDATLTQGTPTPLLAPPLDAYVPTFRITSVDGGAAKRGAISHYTTQLDVDPSHAEQSWLSSFARTDEVFWPEQVAPAQVTTTSRDAPFAHATIDIDDAPGLQLQLEDQGVSLRHQGIVLRSMPIPHGEYAAWTHRWKVSVDHEGSIAEISVRRDDAFWMSAVIATSAAIADQVRSDGPATQTRP